MGTTLQFNSHNTQVIIYERNLGEGFYSMKLVMTNVLI